jgi:hypothetical protein
MKHKIRSHVLPLVAESCNYYFALKREQKVEKVPLEGIILRALGEGLCNHQLRLCFEWLFVYSKASTTSVS